MANTVKKRDKVPSSVPRRKQRMVCLMSEEEVRIVDAYLKKYKISNKARWLRETVLTFIRQKMEEDYPTLFNEHDMIRSRQTTTAPTGTSPLSAALCASAKACFI